MSRPSESAWISTKPSTASQQARHALVRAAIPEHLERLEWSDDRIAAHQRDALRRLLRIAVDGSPFHARRLAGLDPEQFELEDLASVPTMTKADMMDAFDEVLTDARLSRAGIEEHLVRTGWEAEELPGGFVVIASGGSSGLRGVFVYSTAAASEFLVALIRPGLARMIALLGDLPTEPVSLAFIGAGSGAHSTRAFPSLFGGDLLDVTSIAASDPLDSIVQQVNDIQPVLLQGYPSVIRKLAAEQLAGRLRVSPVGVTTTSEPLSGADRAQIDEAFGVGVVDTFGASEGLVGLSAPDDSAVVIASDLAIVELVDAQNRPVPVGVPSAKVLVTNLFNPVQPLIRYELTDSFTRLPDAEKEGYPRVAVEGRTDDELVYDDVVVHPIAIRTVMVKLPAAVEYQVWQTPRGIDVNVVAPAGLDAGDIGQRLAANLRSAGLSDPRVSVRIVDPGAIERHPETGKTRRFIPLSRG